MNLKTHRQYIVLALILAIGALLFFSLKGFINAFLGAILFYVLLKPWMIFLVYKKSWNASLAASLLMLLSFLVILLPVALVSMLMYGKIKELVVHSDEVSAHFLALLSDVEKWFNVPLPIGDLMQKSVGFVQNLAGGILNESASTLGAMVMMYFFLFFLLIRVRILEKELMRWMPFSRNSSIQFGNELVSMTHSAAIGIPVIAIIQGLFAWLAFLIAGMNETFFWASITALVSVVPVVGTALVWIPASIFLLAEGHTWQAIFLMTYGAVVLSNIDNVVRFFIQKKFADVHPVITMLGVVVGLHYFGLPGILFGPLLISWFLLLVKKYQEEFIGRR
ncbi:MAG: AI-2E family transporter [Cytophagaceae bacterium]|jgi:predicted PurR-regulated permease PerM|nr:AI-2E family transporter [Cytophagaceae bacterium]